VYYSFFQGQMMASSLSNRLSRPRVVVLVATIATILASVFACTDISSDPNTVLSLQFDSLPVPGVAVGDTLRDTLGVAVRPAVHAFNFQGDEIVPAPVFFVSPDSGVTVDSASGIITGDSLRSTPARIFADVGSLQAVQKLSVTLRPDRIAAVNAIDSILYSLTDDSRNHSNAVTVSLKHGVAPADSVVGSWIVSFAIVSQHTPGLVELVNDAGKPSLVDTTDASGIAGRQIRLHPVNLDSPTQVDTVVVNATAKFRGAAVSGSPVRLVVVFKPGS
jgi:hypothetical protein